MEAESFNLVAVLLATVLAFVLGGFWYGPLFGKRWQSYMQLTDDELQQGHPALVFGPAFVLTLVQAAALALLLPAGAGLMGAIVFCIAVGVAFVATGFGVNYLFARLPRGLWAIDAGFNVVQFAIMGAVLGFFA